MSREFGSGSIKLLYSSPVTAGQIIWGKFLSMMIYGLILMGVLLVLVIFASCTVEAFDIPAALSGLLGLYLLTCAYAAIGLYMSCLTSYQVVAAVGTLAVLIVLNFIGSVGQDIAFVREITYWLSIKGRATVFIDGLICSEDLLYFMVVILFFLTLGIMKIEAHGGTLRDCGGGYRDVRLYDFPTYVFVVLRHDGEEDANFDRGESRYIGKDERRSDDCYICESFGG